MIFSIYKYRKSDTRKLNIRKLDTINHQLLNDFLITTETLVKSRATLFQRTKGLELVLEITN